jgi:LPS export ABC transporter protein LptC
VRLQKTVIKTKQGQRWELEADEVDWMDNNSQAKAQQVTWFLLGPQGERTVKVESPGADVDMNAEIVTFTGEVVARRLDSPESLVVQHLVYNGKERLFHGSEGVLWKKTGIELAGLTLTATAELDKVQLKGRVKGKTEGGLLKPEDLNSASDQRDR